MNIVPLFKEEAVNKKSNDIQINIPEDWWNSSYSVNFNEKEKAHVYKLSSKKQENLPVTPGWNINKGDYRVREERVAQKDFVYYRDLKIKILKYSIYPVVIITILLILKVSSILSKI